MRFSFLKSGVVFAAGLFAALGQANASVIHNDGFANTQGEYRPTDTSFDVAFTAPSAGNQSISFDIFGARTLDGVNFYQDNFSLALNGTTIFTGSFDLGGGGTDSVLLNLASLATAAAGDRGIAVSGVLALLAGINTLTFSYDSLTTGFAGFQGTGDESWGINSVDVSNANISAVPVPGAVFFLGAGLLGLAGIARKSSKA
jgi:hypothetical protein